MQTILNTLVEERGKACMEYLRDMDDETAKQELSRFKGVGPKTVSCVLMFCLQRAEFPVVRRVGGKRSGAGASKRSRCIYIYILLKDTFPRTFSPVRACERLSHICRRSLSFLFKEIFTVY